MQKHASSVRLTDDLFERALSDSLRDSVHSTRLKEYYYLIHVVENFSYCSRLSWRMAECKRRTDCRYPASRAFLSDKSFSMYIVVRVAGVDCRAYDIQFRLEKPFSCVTRNPTFQAWAKTTPWITLCCLGTTSKSLFLETPKIGTELTLLEAHTVTAVLLYFGQNRSKYLTVCFLTWNCSYNTGKKILKFSCRKNKL